MEGFIEDFGVFTPDHYMYIDDYEHPIDYIHRTYYETINRIHLIQVANERCARRKEVDAQIDPDICICCRNHLGKPDLIKLQENHVKKSKSQLNTPESTTTESNPLKLSTTKSVKTEFNPTISNASSSITTNLNIVKSKSLKSEPDQN